jgi:hypothetical protein
MINPIVIPFLIGLSCPVQMSFTPRQAFRRLLNWRRSKYHTYLVGEKCELAGIRRILD